MRLSSLSRFAPLALRLVFGIIFLSHGWMKLIALAGTTKFFGSIGIPLPGVAAPLIAAIEVLGGIALILGLGSRIFALLLAANMFVAIVVVKLKAGFIGGYEFELALLAGLISLALSGPGALAVIRNSDSKWA